MGKRKTAGRSKGSRNKGFWFRAGRGWYVTEGTSSIPLRDSDGLHIKSKQQEEEAEEAYHRYRTIRDQQTGSGSDTPLMVVCQRYLEYSSRNDSEATYDLRGGMLFDFCTGFPRRFWNSDEEKTAADRVHEGCGSLPVSQLTKADIDHWLAAHEGWKSNRAPVQAVKRALNWAVDRGLIPKNPIKGYKTDPEGRRETYFTDDQEAALYEHADPALRLAIKVMISTGARPVVELGSLEARHVHETDRGQQWRFPAEESKGRKEPRTIFVPEETAKIVRALIKERPAGKLFRDHNGKPWTNKTMRGRFYDLRRKLERRGIKLDEDACAYACRHTFAKRKLGEGKSLETLAGLMGNSPTICWKHYAQWVDSYTDPLWDAIGN